MTSKNAQERNGEARSHPEPRRNGSLFPHASSCTCPDCRSEREPEPEPVYSSNPTPRGNRRVQRTGPRREYRSPRVAAILATLALIFGEIVLALFPIREMEFVIAIAAVVTFLIWQVRCSMNLQPLGMGDQKYSPTVGVVWWFIPIANFILPYLVMGEIWRRSHPNARPGFEPGQPSVPRSRILIPWWLAFGVTGIMSLGTEYAVNSDASAVLLIYEMVALTAVVLVVILIWQISLNQEKKNQEKKRREQGGGT